MLPQNSAQNCENNLPCIKLMQGAALSMFPAGSAFSKKVQGLPSG